MVAGEVKDLKVVSVGSVGRKKEVQPFVRELDRGRMSIETGIRLTTGGRRAVGCYSCRRRPSISRACGIHVVNVCAVHKIGNLDGSAPDDPDVSISCLDDGWV